MKSSGRIAKPMEEHTTTRIMSEALNAVVWNMGCKKGTYMMAI